MTGKLIIHGMMTSQNFGDVLLAQIVTGWLRELTSAELLTAHAAPDVQQILGTRNAKASDYLSADGVLLSGGGYFQMMDRGYHAQKRFVKNTYPLHVGQLLGKPTAMIGVGVDKLPHRSMRMMLRRLLNHSVAVGVRDPNSLAFAKQLGPRRPPTLTNDLVFALRESDIVPEKSAAAGALIAELGRERVVGLHLSGTSSESEDYARLHARLKQLLASAPEDTAFLVIEDHASKGGKGQVEALRELQSYLPDSKSRFVPYAGTAEMLAVLNRLDAVFTNKLHVGLAAAAMGTMPFSLAKNRKNIGSFAALGIGDNCRMLSASADEMDDVLNRAISHRGRFVVPEEIRQLSAKNRELLAQFVKAALPNR